jgi:hypothetical protein
VKVLIILSLLLNIAVLLPVTSGMVTNASWAVDAYGSQSPARGIVLAFYLAILAASVIFLFWPIPEAVAAMLALQIAYKVLTPFTVGTLANPVVNANLGIAAFHAITLAAIVLKLRG